MTVVGLVVALVALAVAVLALRRADVVERRAKQWSGEPAAADTVDVDTTAISDLRARVQRLETSGDTSGLSRVAVVRYDAFEELGGRMSFSAAIVDDAGRGLVLTAIHGRSETRSYLKQVPVTPDSGQRELSPEETQAVAAALAGRR